MPAPAAATPGAERLHIALFGRTNTGKSSLANALTGQEMALVSPVSGTTTDPVSKAMELLPLGPVVIIDTPGLEDASELGEKRIRRAYEVFRRTDLAIVVLDAAAGLRPGDLDLLEELSRRRIPRLLAFNKADLPGARPLAELLAPVPGEKGLLVSATAGLGLAELKAALPGLLPKEEARPIVRDLLSPGDFAVLVVPIDSAAPKGRLILPQQQTIRDALEAGAVPVVVRDTELEGALGRLPAPKLVITDSQAFGRVGKIVPRNLLLTSFSILLSRAKGNLEQQIRGVAALNRLQDGDRVLIAEGCTHHRQCQDIGTVKLPGWIREKLGVQPEFSFTSGGEYPLDLTPYKLVIHCGGCMLTPREMKGRLGEAEAQGVPATNYGLAIASLHGILARSLEVFPEMGKML